MELPNMKYADRYTRSVQVKFKGLNHTEGAADGEIYRMRNMSSNHYPVLATREKRYRVATIENPGGLVALDKLGCVSGTDFYYDGVVRGQVSQGEKTFGVIGTTIIILPDKCYYNAATEVFGSMESKWEGQKLKFCNGLLYGESADANTIQCDGVDWSEWFRAGDAVTIGGCTTHTENNTTPIIREISGDKMYFYENVFTLDGDGLQDYTETGKLSISRDVPDLLFICENDGRLWGCDDRTIYASKPNDIFNWNVFDGLESDAWQVTPEAVGKNVTCFSYKGFAQFFKEDHLYKVYGSYPSNFQVLGSATLGVAEGSGRSLAIAGETLFWLGRNGMVAYTGGIPQNIAKPFGTMKFRNAVAGSDGMKYYVSMEQVGGGWGLYVYDTESGLWHQEDESHVTHFAKCDGQLYMLNDMGEIWLMGNAQNIPEGCTQEEDFAWEVEFADFVEKRPNKKGLNKLYLRMGMEEGTEVQVEIMFDSSGEWDIIWSACCDDSKRSYYLPIVPRRADHYRIKISGTGGCRIYSMTREYYNGSQLKSRGRWN